MWQLAIKHAHHAFPSISKALQEAGPKLKGGGRVRCCVRTQPLLMPAAGTAAGNKHQNLRAAGTCQDMHINRQVAGICQRLRQKPPSSK